MRSVTWEVELPHPIGSQLVGQSTNGGRYYAVVQGALRAAHRKGLVYCLCRQDPASRAGRAMNIRKLSSEELILARNAHTGPEHDPSCSWFRDDRSNSGMQSYTDDVVVETDDGMFRVRLKTSLSPRKPAEKRGPLDGDVARDRGASHTQRSMTQRGLLDFLWDLSGTNIWKHVFAEHREPVQALSRIYSFTERILSGRKGALSTRLSPCVPPAPKKSMRIRKWTYDGDRGIVLGYVTAINPLTGIITLAYDELNAFELHADAVSMERLRESFPRECSLLEHPDTLIVGLFTCDFVYRDRVVRDGSRPNFIRGKVIDAALLATHRASLIPVESSYELAFADFLIREKRSFRKPLRFDASEDVVFPDFILTDTGAAAFPIEVWGRRDPTYLARRAEKTRYFNERFGVRGWTEWDASIPGNPMPRLRPQARYT